MRIMKKARQIYTFVQRKKFPKIIFSEGGTPLKNQYICTLNVYLSIKTFSAKLLVPFYRLFYLYFKQVLSLKSDWVSVSKSVLELHKQNCIEKRKRVHICCEKNFLASRLINFHSLSVESKIRTVSVFFQLKYRQNKTCCKTLATPSRGNENIGFYH